MGKKKSDSKRTSKSGGPVCAGCKNFKPGKDHSGRCGRTDKKRSPTDKACGHFNPL